MQIFIVAIRKAIFFYYAIGQNRLCETSQINTSSPRKDVRLTEQHSDGI